MIYWIIFVYSMLLTCFHWSEQCRTKFHSPAFKTRPANRRPLLPESSPPYRLWLADGGPSRHRSSASPAPSPGREVRDRRRDGEEENLPTARRKERVSPNDILSVFGDFFSVGSWYGANQPKGGSSGISRWVKATDRLQTDGRQVPQMQQWYSIAAEFRSTVVT